MNKKVMVILVGLVLGFIAGYLIFGKAFGGYVNIVSLFDFSGGNLGKFGRSVGGIKAIQQKVFLTSIAGAVLGYLYIRFKKK